MEDIEKIINPYPDETGILYKQKKALLKSQRGLHFIVKKEDHNMIRSLKGRYYIVKGVRTPDSNQLNKVILNFNSSWFYRIPRQIMDQANYPYIWDVCRSNLETFSYFSDEILELEISINGKTINTKYVDCKSPFSISFYLTDEKLNQLKTDIINNDYVLVFKINNMNDQRVQAEKLRLINMPSEIFYNKIISDMKIQYLAYESTMNRQKNFSINQERSPYEKSILKALKSFNEYLAEDQLSMDKDHNSINFSYFIYKEKEFFKILVKMKSWMMLPISADHIHKMLKNQKLRLVQSDIQKQFKDLE